MAQSKANEARTQIQVPGDRPVKTDGLGDYHAQPKGAGVEVVLKRHAVAQAIFEKQSP